MTESSEADAWWKANRGKVQKVIRPGQVIKRGVDPNREKPRKPLPPHDCAITGAISMTRDQALEAVEWFSERNVTYKALHCVTCDGYHTVKDPNARINHTHRARRHHHER